MEYEVRSASIDTANIEYYDLSGPIALQNVALPWRIAVPVANAYSDAAQLHVDWKPAAARYKWVTVRIYTRGSLLCEFTLDEGEATCTGKGLYPGHIRV